MEKGHDIPLILGRPFLTTGKALIDVHRGEVTLRVNEDEVITLRVNEDDVIFNIYRSIKVPDEIATCHRIYTVGDCAVQTQLGSNPKAPLERCLTPSRIDNFELTHVEIIHYIYAIEALQRETTFTQAKKELAQDEDMVEKPPKLEPNTGCFEALNQLFQKVGLNSGWNVGQFPPDVTVYPTTTTGTERKIRRQ